MLHSAAADIWSKGDKVSVFFMCRDEEDIMDIALADSKNEASYVTILNVKRLEGTCQRIYPPVGLSVESVVSSYVDHKEKETSILKLYDPDTNIKAGYIIAEGRPANSKETSH